MYKLRFEITDCNVSTEIFYGYFEAPNYYKLKTFLGQFNFIQTFHMQDIKFRNMTK